MPRSNYREDIVDVISARMEEFIEVKKGKIFGHPGFSINNRFFCFAYEDGLSLKLSLDDYNSILELEEADKFKPNNSPMGTWAVLTYPEAEEYINNWEWIDKAMAYIVTDEAAPRKKKKNQIRKN